MFKLNLAILSIISICSCANAPGIYFPLDEAKAEIEKTKNLKGINQIASAILFEADEQIKKAETAINENKITSADHHIYLAKRKRQIAQELLLKHQQEQELEKLKQQQLEMKAHARNIESNQTTKETHRAQQHIQLEQTLRQYKAEESNRDTILIINDQLFDTDGTNLKPQSQRQLEPLLKFLQDNSQCEIIIEGHTDSIGNPKNNKILSLKRADTVKNFLILRGINLVRIETRGFGEEVPIATNTTKVGRSLNRRVEIVIKTP